MACTTERQNPEQSQTPLDTLLDAHLNGLRIKGYSPYTIRNRLVHIRMFVRWCTKMGVSRPSEISPTVVERYQQHVYDYRKKDGQPLTVASRYARLVPLRVWFRWMARQRLIRKDLSAELPLPRLGRTLPKNILSAPEIERVLSQPRLRTAVGLRDRAILEVLYSTGIRRLELVRLKLEDLQLDRKLIFVRQGKGDKDRYVPIGERAVGWLQRYLRRARKRLAGNTESDAVFLTVRGQPISRDHLTYIARKHIAAAKLGKSGACHLFRHSMATLMHENGADIRCLQQILGHEDIRTTQIYTHVAIRRIQEVHAATHPAAAA